MFILLGFICLLLFLSISAWISSAEIAVTALSPFRIKKLIAQNPKLSHTLFLWLKSPYYLLTLILTINVISDMLISFLSTFVLISAFDMLNRHIVELAAWLITSFAVLIAGEITPKIYARAHSEQITIFSIPRLAKIEKILKPFIYPIIKFAELLSPKTSIPMSYELSDEEAERIINEGGISGALDKETSNMLKRTLNFSDLSVQKIMQPIDKIDSVDFALDNEKFLNAVVETSRSRTPIYKNDKSNIIGYIHIKDIMLAWREGKTNFVKNLIKKPYLVSEDLKINYLLKKFKSGKTHIAFIKNKKGKITGIAALEDILEEVVGEIVDEYEVKE
ncbi:MAG: CNNM domain-containing protein [Elusimicrobiota bacterium]|jgi:CBS domain containing-hemolysin-like protein|nr:CNNM domain-containing protein [Elusimicrobiota bacterium]